MNLRLSLLSAALVSLLFSAPANAVTPLFTETFASNDVAWSYGTGGTPSTDNDGWSWSGSYYKAKHAVRLGKSKGEVGSATTPSLSIPSAWSKASVTVSFQAAAWYGYSSGLTLSKIENGLTTELDSWSVPQIAANLVDATNNVADLSAFTSDSNGKPYTSTFEVRDSFKLVFATTGSGNNCRSYLDTVVVTAEEIVSTLTTLPTPANLDTNALSYTGFSLVWDEVSGATGYVVRVDGNVMARCPPETRTASVTGLAAGGTYAVTVVAQGDGTTTEDSPAAPLSVLTPAYPATIVPDPKASGVSTSAFTVSWTQHAGETYSIRAWTLVPANESSEYFTAWYNQNLTLPSGWTKEGNLGRYNVVASPIAFNENNQSLTSPIFEGTVTNLSFVVRRYNGSEDKPSTFRVYGSSGETGAEWYFLKELDLFSEIGTSGTKVIINSDSVPSLSNYHCFRFVYEKDGGTCGFGSFVLTGLGVGKASSHLEGYGPAATSVNTTSVTISNPVAGKTNYVEVTATGLSGRTESKTISVDVPSASHPVVISVK